MNLHEDKSIKFKPITLLVIILLIGLGVSLFFNLTGDSGIKQLKEQSKLLQKQKDSLLNRVKTSQPRIEKDSLKVILLTNQVKEKDSLLNIVNNSEKFYKNKWYNTYKKLKNAQKNYNDADRRTRDSLAIALARRKG